MGCEYGARCGEFLTRSAARVDLHRFGARRGPRVQRSIRRGVVGGVTAFSNDNQRLQLRTRWSYALDERYGLNAFLKTRSYRHSNPYRPEYFSPNRLHEAALGLSARLAVADNVVLNASLDAGQQWIDGDSQTTWSAVVGLASGHGSKTQWKLGLETSNSASQLSSQTASYRYTSAMAQLTIPG